MSVPLNYPSHMIKVEKSGNKYNDWTREPQGMKPKSWDKFLKDMAGDFGLRGKLKELFLVRFAYENWRKPDTEVWQLAEAASHETYKKQMTQLYSRFTNDKEDGCAELDLHSKGPGKFQILREWLKDIKYPEWQSINHPSLAYVAVNPPSFQSGDQTTYIPRPPIETDCFQEMLKPGALLRIRAPEKMGKTSLINQILIQSEVCGCRKVYLNFRAAEKAMFTSLDKFLRWFCANVSRELGMPPSLDDYWDEELFGSLVSCQTYFQNYILEQLDCPLVLGLDNVDRLFEYEDIAADFLPMLRYWHEEANNSEVWQNLRLVIANSTEAYVKLDANQSPFNVGKQIKLPGFNLDQVMKLAESKGLTPENGKNEAFAEQLIDLVGGHPYLVEIAMEALASDRLKPQQLLEEAPSQSGIYSAHLRHYWNALQTMPELAVAMGNVIRTQEGVKLDPTLAYQLDSMGLVNLVGDEAKVGCQLYQQYFQLNAEFSEISP